VPGLLPGTSSASFTGQEPGDVAIEVVYTPPDAGEPCPATHHVTVFGVESIAGPSCVHSGTTLTREDFSIVTNPSGFEDHVIVSPLSFSTLSQSAEVTVTAYSGTGAKSDEATTTITVVNSNVKTIKGLSFEIPNYIKKPLEVIGLAQKLTLKVSNDYNSFIECCAVGAAKSTDGKTTVDLSIDAGPFTIIGVPIPPNFKKWVAADLLNITLSGVGSVGLNGSYNACEDNTIWSGGGDLAAGVKALSMVKAEVPKVIVLKGEIAGSTNITEKLSTDLTNLKLTTKWGGLTALGNVTILIRKRKILNFEVSRTCFEKDNLSTVTIALPSLE
jgi:hypothetical protein